MLSVLGNVASVGQFLVALLVWLDIKPKALRNYLASSRKRKTIALLLVTTGIATALWTHGYVRASDRRSTSQQQTVQQSGQGNINIQGDQNNIVIPAPAPTTKPEPVNQRDTKSAQSAPQVSSLPDLPNRKSASVRIQRLEPHAITVGEPPKFNVYFMNVGDIKATVQNYWWTSLEVSPNTVAESAKLEVRLYGSLKEYIAKTSDGAAANEVSPGGPVIHWFTQIAPWLTTDDIAQALREERMRLYFLGVFKYRDADGVRRGFTRYTTYCHYTHGGDPRVIFACHRYNDQNVDKL